ncbi:MAG TPA: hypothetical protein VK133_04215 [Amoebophilaceae bacterium]|jgi:Na+/proline symporter|nr:hypothetical protein [Amoebophilaceae bacterium]
MKLAIIPLFLFLLTNILITVYGSKNTATLKNHTLLLKGFNTSAIVSSIIAVSYGGGIFYNKLSAYYLLLCIGNAIGCFIIANILPHRLSFFFDSLSVAEIVGRLYGRNLRIVAAICGILSGIIVSAIQIKALAMIIDAFFPIPMPYSVLFATIFIVSMVRLGNMQSLVSVNIIRNIAFVLFITTFVWLLWKMFILQDFSKHLSLTLTIKDAWSTFLQKQDSWTDLIPYCMVLSIPSLHPAQVQCILMANNPKKVQNSFNYAGFFVLSINLFLVWISLLLNMHTSNASMVETLRTFIPYIDLQGPLIISTAALSISALGINIYTVTLLIANDLQKVCFKRTPTELNPQRYVIVVALIAMLFALYTSNMLKSILISRLVFLPVSIPLLLGLLGIYLHRRIVSVSMALTGLTILLWPLCMKEPITRSFLPAMFVQLVTLIGGRLFFPSYRKQADYQTLTAMLAKGSTPTFAVICKETLVRIRSQIKNFSLFQYLEQQFPKENTYYVLFSVYILTKAYGSFHTLSTNAVWGPRLETFILFPSFIVATYLIIYASIVPSKCWIHFTALIWQLSVLYFLYVVDAAMLFLSGFTYLQLTICVASFCVSVLFSSFLILFIRILLTLLTVAFVFPYIGLDNYILTFINVFAHLDTGCLYPMLLIAILLIGLCFLKARFQKLTGMVQKLRAAQEDEKNKQFFKEQQITRVAYETDYIINEFYKKIKNAFLGVNDDMIPLIDAKTTSLQKYFGNVFSYLKYDAFLKTHIISIEQLLQECFQQMRFKSIYDYPYVIMDTEQSYVQCGVDRIEKLIVNSLSDCRDSMAFKLGAQVQDVYIYVCDTKLAYAFTLSKDTIQVVDAICLVVTTEEQRFAAMPSYTVSQLGGICNMEDSKKDPLYDENHSIVDTHYGYSEITHTEQGITHLYVVPVDVACVAKNFICFTPLEPSSQHEEVTEQVGMKEITLFLEKVQKKAWLDDALVKDTIEFIKLYYTKQRRQTGASYLAPIAVASILLDITEQQDLIIASLTYDVVQHTFFTKAGLSTLVGEHVTKIICFSDTLEKKLPPKKIDYLGYIEHIVQPENQLAIFLRLAIVLYNARTLSDYEYEKQIERVKIMKRFYVPLAEKMHLTSIANELRSYLTSVYGQPIL